ncbi:MAG: MFS transporter [Trueperaceae bacterium]|nr:MFS transporter [Trueperaceae bacterium]
MTGLRRRLPLTSERGVTGRFALLAGLQEFAIWLPLPVLVLHMTDRGLDLAAIGFAFALRAIFVVLLEVPTGGLADAIGRKPIALVSQACTFVSFALLLFVGGPFMLLLYAVFQGIGAALHSGALDAWYVDKLTALDTPVSLQKNLARIGVAQTAAMLAGAAIGGVLPSLLSGWNLPWPLAGFGIALFAGLVLRALALWLTLALVEEPEYAGARTLSRARGTPAVIRDGLRLARSIPVMPYLLLAGVAMGVATISLETFWQPIAGLTFGTDPESSGVFGLLGFVLGAAGLLGSLAVMHFGDRFPGGPVALAAASQILKGGAMLVLATQAGGAGVAIGLGLAYFAISTQNVPHDALLNDAVPSQRRSIMLSLNSLVFFLGIAIGSGTLGFVASLGDPRLALAIGAVFTLVSVVAYAGVALVARRRPPEVPVAEARVESSDES